MAVARAASGWTASRATRTAGGSRQAMVPVSEHDAILRLQRQVGNRAVNSLLAGARPRTTQIQRAGTHFQDFLKKGKPGLDPANVPTDKGLGICAWLIDQNIYELAEWLGNEREPSFEHMARLGKIGATLDDVRTFLVTNGAPPPEADHGARMGWLSSFINTVPRGLTGAIGDDVHARTTIRTSQVNWFGLTAWGAGTGGQLVMHPGGIQKGSGAGGDPVWMKRVEQHLAPGGSTTIFVRGHLLNYDLGGPGLDYNMVPITGKPAKNCGGNDSNGEHYTKAEADAKNVLAGVENGHYTTGFYEVIPTYGRSPRPATAQVRAEVTALRTLLATQEQTVSAGLAAGGDPAMTNAFTQAYTSRNVPVPNPLPSLSDQRAFVAKSTMYELGQQTLGQLRAANHPLAVAIDAQLNRAILDASTAWTTDSCKLYDLLNLLDGNAGTWEAEDQVVPTDLRVTLAWVPAAGPQAGIKQQKNTPIDVTLPTDSGAVAFRPKKGSEIA